MIMQDNIHKILYGGDYNPEQWDKEIWQEDMRLLKLANIDIVTLNVFSWSSLQKDETTYDFSQLDEIIDLVTRNGMKICLATATGAHPAWMAKKFPDVLRVEFNGMKRKFGSRHNSCPNSPNFQKYSQLLVEKIVTRYQNQKNIVAWHVSNEYGGSCYCENCEKAFRIWLKNKYKTIDCLNRAWNTSFWGHNFYEWDEIVAPNLLSEHFAENRTTFQGISLDYARFNSDSMLENYKVEQAIIKKHMPQVPVTTNMMGFYKTLDYQKWAKEMDFVSWDSYPSNDAPISKTAMNHDVMRGVKNGKPFALMEQTPSVSNWLSYNALKRPGVMRLWSYQAIAHGADTVMFFQMRRSAGACEKYHGAVIDHVGNENTRVFKECTELGAELAKIGEKTLGSLIKSKVAIVFDWNNWWAIEYSAGPNADLKYVDEIFNYYKALHGMNISVDIIGVDEDLTDYNLVIAPVLYMVKPNFDDKLKTYVENGGKFISTFFSGIVDENDSVTLGGYPGKLKELLGIWVEEIDALPKDVENSFTYNGKQYPSVLLCDILHCNTAKSMATYEKDFYEGYPSITKNTYGKGTAYYVATRSNDDFYSEFLNDICKESDISPILKAPADVEVTQRVKGDTAYIFALNHGKETVQLLAEKACTDILTSKSYSKEEFIELPSKGVAILERKEV